MGKKKCVICDLEPGVGVLARAYAAGSRRGYREADTPPDDEVTEDSMCATHRQQVADAEVALMIRTARKGASSKGRQG